ncbi:substrate-binding and VWA domain-containing protein [Amycolatopsis pigmentata]|uniref:Substrate-binding and VWA domain-containing protein n=1 Tax=Amycolatopsis pigmentata TaxID=450801 RepID=A0ABW5G6Q0_9PSEU
MGRHLPPTKRGVRAPVVVAGVVVVLFAAGTLTVVSLTKGAPPCANAVPVKVAAAPEIAPMVNEIGHAVEEADPCYAFDVDDRDPGAIEESLEVVGNSEKPDVWISDSTLRLRRANAEGAADVPSSGFSIADSPVVFAVTEPAAAGLGWPGRTPGWSDILGDSRITLGIPDPSRDPVGISALMGVRQALSTTGAKDGDTSLAYASVLRRFSANTLPAVDDLYSRLPSAGGSKEPVTAFPSSENSLLRNNVRESAANGRGSLVAVYPPQPIPSLDYPFAVLAGTGRDQAAGAEKLLRALLDPAGQAALAGAGFRTPDGRSLLTRSQDDHVSVVTQNLAQMPSDSALDSLITEWSKVNQSSRARVLIDASAAMNTVVPRSGGRTRMDLTTDAVARGLNLFKPTSELSTWIFATDLDGRRDYREVIPMTPVSDLLTDRAADTIRGLHATPDGRLGLFDSVLEAYRDARDGWEVGRLNLLIVLTGGRNDDPRDLNLDKFLTEMGKLTDPQRPVPVIAVGVGPDADLTQLNAITGVTGGRTVAATDATDVANVLYNALAALAGAGS